MRWAAIVVMAVVPSWGWGALAPDPEESAAAPSQLASAGNAASERAIAICELASSDSVSADVAAAAQETCLAWLSFERDKFARVIGPEVRWQQFSTRLLFAMVLGLVVVGVALACVQFWIALKAAREESLAVKSTTQSDSTAAEASSAGSGAKPKDLEGEISLGPKGLTVRSSFLGLLLLALSLAFFHVYLVHVYPLHVLGERAPNSLGQDSWAR